MEPRHGRRVEFNRLRAGVLGLRRGRDVPLRSARTWRSSHPSRLLAQWKLSESTSSNSSPRPAVVSLYVCAECGDLGCGAITALVQRTPDGFVWRDFVFEDNYDASITGAESYRAVGPFVFNKTEYWRVLNERATSLSAS